MAEWCLCYLYAFDVVHVVGLIKGYIDPKGTE